MPIAPTDLTYIQLKYSDGTGAKKFAVVMGTLLPVSHKNQTVRRTPEGRLDITEGPQTVTHQMTLRCHRVGTGLDDRGATYGVYADLQAFWAKKNPRAVPSNLIIYVDHLNVSHNVYLVGDFPTENITPHLDGSDSVYFIPLVMEEA